ncbi:cytochrome ubiquinol oxidase subunit I [candidate division KSB1 bacterium]
MQYPVWELEFGAPLMIAVISILHVYISHFAIGGGLFLVITEHYAYRKNDASLLEYLKKHSKFFALVTLVLGAITGVGIWFTIGLLSPAGTSSLIHIFVWGWAVEWVFFLVEIIAAIIYYITWDRLSRKDHLRIGWIYFISAFLSLVVINGILTFMLTPGQWIENGNFWSAFLNPGYFPSLLTRTAFCISLAGIYALVTSAFLKNRDTKRSMFQYTGLWILTGAALSLPALKWYISTFPVPLGEYLSGTAPTIASAYQVIFWAGIIFVLLTVIPVVLPKNFNLGIAVVIMVYGLIVFGSAEWIRETARKPYVIYDYMYGNGLHKDNYSSIRENGGLSAATIFVTNNIPDPDIDTGRDIFRIACRSCHTVDGYRGLKDPVSGLDRDFLYGLVDKVENMKGNMPPFPGIETEKQALAEYLFSLNDDKIELLTGYNVFQKRCGFCHTRNKYRGLNDFFYGQYKEDILEMLPLLSDMIDLMPPWSGSDEETEMLAEYIAAWYTDEDTDKQYLP